MKIDPAVHERFVEEFGLNMLNTLTSKEHRLTAHKRRIYVFDERGGVCGGSGDSVEGYQNLTTGVFYSHQRKIVGVRYRCKPNDLTMPALGAFHTHPALFSTNIRQVRRRIDRLLWMSEMDRLAFIKQNELYGFQWHFIGTIDIGCFHIDDVKDGSLQPREIIRYPNLPEVIDRLGPQIEFYDRILQSQAKLTRGVDKSILEQVFHRTTGVKGALEDILSSAGLDIPATAQKVAIECQLMGLSSRQIGSILKRVPQVDEEVRSGFQLRIEEAYKKLSALVP